MEVNCSFLSQLFLFPRHSCETNRYWVWCWTLSLSEMASNRLKSAAHVFDKVQFDVDFEESANSMHKLFEWHSNNWSWWFKRSTNIPTVRHKRAIDSYSLPKSKLYGGQICRWIFVDGTKWMRTGAARGVVMPFTPSPLSDCTCVRRRSCYSHWFECQDEHGIGFFTKK